MKTTWNKPLFVSFWQHQAARQYNMNKKTVYIERPSIACSLPGIEDVSTNQGPTQVTPNLSRSFSCLARLDSRPAI
jgi:hypothetical protein